MLEFIRMFIGWLRRLQGLTTIEHILFCKQLTADVADKEQVLWFDGKKINLNWLIGVMLQNIEHAFRTHSSGCNLDVLIHLMRKILGHTGYYRRFIYRYATIAMPLIELLKKGEDVPVWTSACTHAFNILKRKLLSAPILIPPNWEKEFHIFVDASNVAIGSFLSQKDENSHDHPIYFTSRQLVQAERNYTVMEREALGMIFSV
jgi:hypothetical protein